MMIMLYKFCLQRSYSISIQWHAQTWRTERKAERGKGERCKEVPRGSISPASEHINRSQPYYSQSKADENRRKKIHWRQGGKGAKKKAENPQNRATTREFTMWQKKHGAAPSNMWVELPRTENVHVRYQWSKSVSQTVPKSACFIWLWWEMEDLLSNQWKSNQERQQREAFGRT